MVMHPTGVVAMYIGTTPFPEVTRASNVPWLHAASGSITWWGASANATPALSRARHALRPFTRGYGAGSLASVRRSAYLRRPVQPQRADLEGILGFLADVASLDFDELYPPEVLASLQGLVPCDDVTYHA